MNYPYSDDYMIFNAEAQRYVLTEKDVRENLAIDIIERMKNTNLVNSFLNLISVQVYAYIHEFNTNNAFQDYVISTTETGRKIIKETMENQLQYVMINGDLRRSTDKEKRALWFDDTARDILLRPIPEIGTTICYTGVFRGICR